MKNAENIKPQVLSDNDLEEGRKYDTPWKLDPFGGQPLITRVEQHYICGRDADWIDKFVCRGPKKGEHGSTEDYSDIKIFDLTSMNNAKVYVMRSINVRKYGILRAIFVNWGMGKIDPFEYQSLGVGAMFMRSIK